MKKSQITMPTLTSPIRVAIYMLALLGIASAATRSLTFSLTTVLVGIAFLVLIIAQERKNIRSAKEGTKPSLKNEYFWLSIGGLWIAAMWLYTHWNNLVASLPLLIVGLMSLLILRLIARNAYVAEKPS